MKNVIVRAAVFLSIFSFYLLGESRELLWADSKAVYLPAEHFLYDKGWELGYAWPPGAPCASNGKCYSVYPALPTLVQLPAAYFQKKQKEKSPAIAHFTNPIATHVSCAALAALACMLFFGLCLDLGIGLGAASLVTVALGAGTLLWPYAHDPFSEALQTACFTGFFAEVVAVGDKRHRGLALGLWGGALVNTKLIFGLALPGAALYLVVRLWGDWKRLGLVVVLGLIGLAPFVYLQLWWSFLRWGKYTEPAVDSNAGLFTENAFFGLWGFLASPGRSIFRYSPPLLVSLVALPIFWRAYRRVAVAILLTCAPIVYLYCKYALWPGEHSWGPRYLLFLHPVALLPAALLLDRCIAEGMRRWQKLVLALILVAGIAVQLLGNVFWRGAWIRLSQEVAKSWLGTPRRVMENEIEDFHARVWLPPFDPLAGHWWLFRHRGLADDPIETAELDAPWRRWTDLPVPKGAFYEPARVDWWPLLWIDDDPHHRRLGSQILGVELGMLAVGVAGWLFAVRRRYGAHSRGPSGMAGGARSRVMTGRPTDAAE